MPSNLVGTTNYAIQTQILSSGGWKICCRGMAETLKDPTRLPRNQVQLIDGAFVVATSGCTDNEPAAKDAVAAD